VLLLGLALLAALALATYVPSDPVFRRAAVGNRAGILGARLPRCSSTFVRGSSAVSRWASSALA
jgi:hypothetical protein